MLITDEHNVGDKCLSYTEGVEQLKEKNAAMDAKRRIEGQAELEDPERAAGPRLAYQELLYRLWKCNPAIIVKEGLPGSLALYVPTVEDGKRELKYVGGFTKQPLAEYSYLLTDEKGLPLEEVRGWRTVLITMVTAGVITYRDTVKYFGHANGSRSSRWYQAVRAHI